MGNLPTYITLGGVFLPVDDSCSNKKIIYLNIKLRMHFKRGAFRAIELTETSRLILRQPV